jgi:hypothetical protein
MCGATKDVRFGSKADINLKIQFEHVLLPNKRSRMGHHVNVSVSSIEKSAELGSL